jgi:hypothetical protein
MERASFKFCLAHIRFEKGRLGDVSSSPDDLLCGPINADDRVPECNEITRDWMPAPQPRLRTRPPPVGKPSRRRSSSVRTEGERMELSLPNGASIAPRVKTWPIRQPREHLSGGQRES